mgnify:FL=1
MIVCLGCNRKGDLEQVIANLQEFKELLTHPDVISGGPKALACDRCGRNFPYSAEFRWVNLKKSLRRAISELQNIAVELDELRPGPIDAAKADEDMPWKRKL